LALRTEKCGAACQGNSGDEAAAGFAGFSLPAVSLQFKLKVTTFTAFIDKVINSGASTCNCHLKYMVGRFDNFSPIIF